MSTGTANTADIIKKILVSNVYVEIPVPQMDENASLRDVFGVDSLGFVELRAQCEDEFDITIPDDDFTMESFSTIAQVAAIVDRFVAEKGMTQAATVNE